MSLKTLITGGGDGLIAKVDNALDGKNRLHVNAILDTTNQQAIPITFALPGGGALPKMISFFYNETVGAIVANQWRRAITYTIPIGYNGYLIRYTSFQAEAAYSRVVSVTDMGSLNIITNVFTGGQLENEYVSPQFTSDLEVEVTQAIGSASDVVITIEYTNELGISAHTGTVTFTKNSIIGTRKRITLQAGDLGVRSIQTASTSPTSSSGGVKFIGLVQLGYHEDGGTNFMETMYSPGATTFPSGATMGIEHQGGLVSKTRRFDVLVQLVEAD